MKFIPADHVFILPKVSTLVGVNLKTSVKTGYVFEAQTGGFKFNVVKSNSTPPSHKELGDHREVAKQYREFIDFICKHPGIQGLGCDKISIGRFNGYSICEVVLDCGFETEDHIFSKIGAITFREELKGYDRLTEVLKNMIDILKDFMKIEPPKE